MVLLHLNSSFKHLCERDSGLYYIRLGVCGECGGRVGECVFSGGAQVLIFSTQGGIFGLSEEFSEEAAEELWIRQGVRQGGDGGGMSGFRRGECLGGL